MCLGCSEFEHCLTPHDQQQPGSHGGGGNYGDDDIRMKPTTRTQCPTLLRKVTGALDVPHADSVAHFGLCNW